MLNGISRETIMYMYAFEYIVRCSSLNDRTKQSIKFVEILKMPNH